METDSQNHHFSVVAELLRHEMMQPPVVLSSTNRLLAGLGQVEEN